MNHHTYLIMGVIIGSFCFSSVVFVALFSPQNMAIVPWIVVALSAMGVALGYFASRDRKS